MRYLFARFNLSPLSPAQMRLTKLGNQATLSLINGYQRHLSPIKGFKCAAGQHYGDATCSAVIKAIVQTDGIAKGLPAITAQFKRCQHAAQQLKASGQSQTGVFCCVLPIPL